MNDRDCDDLCCVACGLAPCLSLVTAVREGHTDEAVRLWALHQHGWWSESVSHSDWRREATLLTTGAALTNLERWHTTGEIPPSVDVSERAISDCEKLLRSASDRLGLPPTGDGIPVSVKRALLVTFSVASLIAGLALIALARLAATPLLVMALGLLFLVVGAMTLRRSLSRQARVIEREFDDVLRNL